MKLLRAIWLSILLYIVSLAVGLLVFSDVSTITSFTQISTFDWIVGILVTAILGIIFAKWYFSKENVVRTKIEGLKFAIVAIVIGFLFDLGFTIVGKRTDAVLLPLDVYVLPQFWVSLLVFVLVCMVVGNCKRGKKKVSETKEVTVQKKAVKKTPNSKKSQKKDVSKATPAKKKVVKQVTKKSESEPVQTDSSSEKVEDKKE